MNTAYLKVTGIYRVYRRVLLHFRRESVDPNMDQQPSLSSHRYCHWVRGSIRIHGTMHIDRIVESDMYTIETAVLVQS